MVIRRGKMVGETLPSEADKNSLAAMMVGRDVNLVVERNIRNRVILFWKSKT